MDVAYVLRSLEQELRAGYSFHQAVEGVSHDREGPDALAADLTAGNDLIESLAASEGQHPPEARPLLGAMRLQTDDYCNLADTPATLHRARTRG